MKKVLLCTCLLFVALSGCRSVSSITRNLTGADDTLVAQLPEDQLKPVDEARYRVNVAKEEVELATLKQKRASHQAAVAGYEVDLAKNRQQQQEIELDVARENALTKAGFREQEDSVKNLATYNEERIANESKRYDVENKIKKEQLRIEDLTSRIVNQEQRVAAMGHSQSLSFPEVQKRAVESKAVNTDMPKHGGEKASAAAKKDVELPDYLKVEDDPEVLNKPAEKSTVEEGALKN